MCVPVAQWIGLLLLPAMQRRFYYLQVGNPIHHEDDRKNISLMASEFEQFYYMIYYSV